MFQVIDDRILWDGQVVGVLFLAEGTIRNRVVEALHEYDPEAIIRSKLEEVERERDEMERRLDDLRDKIRNIFDDPF